MFKLTVPLYSFWIKSISWVLSDCSTPSPVASLFSKALKVRLIWIGWMVRYFETAVSRAFTSTAFPVVLTWSIISSRVPYPPCSLLTADCDSHSSRRRRAPHRTRVHGLFRLSTKVTRGTWRGHFGAKVARA